MAKLGWNLIHRKDDLWVKVIRSKYRCGGDLLPTIDIERKGSNVWSDIKNSWKYVEAGIEVDTSRGLVRWKHESSGFFPVKSAYASIVKETSSRDRIWNHLWKLPILQRSKSFLWLALHNKLLSNEVRHHRKIGNDTSCQNCGDHMESLLHILRNCHNTRDL